MSKVYVIAIVLLSLGCADSKDQLSTSDRLVGRACEYLMDRQSEDGGWHSVTHGLMSSGQATTPFVFYALLEACSVPTHVRERAVGFIRRHISDNGAVGLSDPDILDYPNYATAYSLLALKKNGDADDVPAIRSMLDYLVLQQFNENRGIRFAHPAYGGWGFGETIFPEGSVGHVDLSHTRRAIQALRAGGHSNEETYRQATTFLRLHQKQATDQRVRSILGDSAEVAYDGGFFASAVVPVVNKSTMIDLREGTALFTSYASTTADGLLALLAAGHGRDDPDVVDAYRWLENHANLSYPEGIPEDHPAQWGRVMFFYHLMVRGEVYRAMNTEGPWRAAIVDLIVGRQRKDGSFSNPDGAPNKEDDPLLATGMVLIALGSDLNLSNL